MSESTNSMLFVCKWLDSHSKPQYFKTVKELKKHVSKHDINSCNKSLLGNQIYICPWKDCKKSHNNNIMLEEHLRKHIQQRPFKCSVCNTRFDTPVALGQHLINNHKDSFTDFTSDDEIEELSSDSSEVDVLVKEKVGRDEANILIDGKVKVSPTSHTAKLSYRDVLIKGSVNNDVVNTSKKGSPDTKYPFSMSYDQREEGWKLYYEGLIAISDMAEKKIEKKLANYNPNNIDNLPEAPKDHLTEEEEEKLFWETMYDVYKGTDAIMMLTKAREMLGMKKIYS
ncbi:hypothetical protein RclHR1_03980029 [Rhizophagus clarus]|uniref:Zinc finger protein GLIS2-like n=1 Tax=Rhizophagus clarus TaxID=94130 RepID=A0A2Z6RI57_9GLOM|nr:hypothetical protein RclHR1_03980029 [Rhizophagus clarus]GES75875.1 zinc finger protein GLIS2-like [Rhizophagus clarus]